SFVSDKIDGLKAFYSGVGGSSYADTTTEYYDGSGNVSSSVSLGATFTDPTQAPTNGNSTSTILAEVCKLYPAPISGGYYPVYVDSPRGSACYCACHSAGSCNGTPVQFAFFFSMDSDPGCTSGGQTGSYTSGHTNSTGLANLANVSGHELSA